MPVSLPAGRQSSSLLGVEPRETFKAVAGLYGRARPAYPEALYEDLQVLTGLGAGARILEIAPGTGQATVALARRR